MRSRALLLGTALLLSGCSFSSDAMWPSLTGDSAPSEDTAGTEATATAAGGDGMAATQQAQSATALPGQPQLGNSDFRPTGVTPGAPTGTFVGHKVQQLREELRQLQDSLATHNRELQETRVKTVQDSQRYHGTVAAINARLQVGTTPGNPILVEQFGSAQQELERITNDITAMNKLANEVAEDSTMAAYLLESTQAAFSLSGAVDEDHEQLAVLNDEVNQTVVLIERLLKEVADDVRRQTNYVSVERSNLNTLRAGVKTGEIYGESLVNRSFFTADRSPLPAAPAADVAGRRPLVVIRFDKPTVNYQQPLYNTINQVLEQRPNATFDLVAVTPATGGTAQVAINTAKARRAAENVLRSLTEMGLPPARVALSARTSPQAQSIETHLFLR